LAPQPRYTSRSPSPFADEKPPLPPKKADSNKRPPYSFPHPTPGPPPTERGNPQQSLPPLPKRLPLRKRDRIILSADLILSTVEESARQILDVGTNEFSKVVAHRHGQEAGENAALAAGTARNLALVYIDMRGIGRRAIIRKTGREFVKAGIRNRNSSRQQDAVISNQQQSPYDQYPGTPPRAVPSTSIPTRSEVPPPYGGSHPVPPLPPRSYEKKG